VSTVDSRQWYNYNLLNEHPRLYQQTHGLLECNGGTINFKYDTI